MMEMVGQQGFMMSKEGMRLSLIQELDGLKSLVEGEQNMDDELKKLELGMIG